MNSVEDMKIMWNEPNGMTEVFGIYLFGLFNSIIPLHTYEMITSIWTPLKIESVMSSWNYDEGTVCDIAVRLVRQPDQPLDLKTWLIYIEASLASFIRVGAIAAWAGFEDSSPCPEIFDTNIMAGNAFAANTPNFGFMCNATLENPTSPLTLTQMNWIWVEIGRNRSES